MDRQKKYHAFISYSHKDCGIIAPKIQEGIENISKPWHRIRRNVNVFRDQTNSAASPQLWLEIENAIINSTHFILLASPSAARSSWVEKEINVWKNKKTDDPKKNFYIALIDGEIEWDESKNDFNWEISTCIPRGLSSYFSTEPLWIDFREFKNKPFNYKEISFASKIAKIVGPLINKDPREVYSIEMKRAIKQKSAIGSILVFFLAITFAWISSNQQKRRAELSSKSNYLIATGNSISGTDINKALLFYYYGFLLTPNDNNFNLFKNYYDQSIIIYDDIEKGKNDTINKFYSLLKDESKNPRQLNSTPENLHLCIPEKIYYYIDNHTIVTGNLASNSDSENKIHFNKEYSSDCMSSPLSTTVYFYNQRPKQKYFNPDKETLIDTILFSFELKTKKITPFACSKSTHLNAVANSSDWPSLINTINPLKSDFKFEESKHDDFKNTISDDGHYLLLYSDLIRLDESYHKLPLKIFVFDLIKKDISEHIIDFKQYEKAIGKFSDGDRIEEVKISKDGSSLYIMIHRFNGTYQSFIFDLLSDRLKFNINSREICHNTETARNLSFFAWGNNRFYFVCGTYDGKLLVYLNKNVDNPFELQSLDANTITTTKNSTDRITSIEATNKYIICGTSYGAIYFWSIQKHREDIILNNQTSVQMPPLYNYPSAIIRLVYDSLNNCLYSVNDLGKIYKFNLKYYNELSRDPLTLKKQIKDLEIGDLSADDKKKYGIEKLNFE